MAIQEYPTDTGIADYVLFVDRQAVGIVEAKREEEGHRLTSYENTVNRNFQEWVFKKQVGALKFSEE